MTNPEPAVGILPGIALPDLGLPPVRNDHHVDRGLRVPTRDGESLLADHYVPETDEPRGTLLVRTPYGRGFPTGPVLAQPYAERGYHVLVQSVRGTSGSSGVFEPMVHEAGDAADTMRWLRGQEWFDGRLGTLGPSYLGFVQYGLMMDEPEELKASVVMMAPHDFGRAAIRGDGIFALETFLGWSDSAGGQISGLSQQELIARAMSAPQRLGPVMNALPMIDAASSTLEDHAPWYRQWLLHPDPRDEFWTAYDHTEGLNRTRSSVLLIAGWSDIFLEQMAQQYAVLHDRGLDVAMTIGDWEHDASFSAGAATIHQQALAWFDQHLAAAPRARKEPVSIQLAGPGQWLDLPAWPPKVTERSWSLAVEGRLDASSAAPDTDQVSFLYDPANPTPSLSGRTYTGAGRVDNTALEARPDVLTFTSDPLEDDIDIVGFPTAELNLSVDNPHADLFLRLCDVDQAGVSSNITDVIQRLDPAVPAGRPQNLTLTLDPCAYRITARHRVRLQISGGAHPRYARNLGVPGPQTTATDTAPSTHTISLHESRIVLPTLPR